MTYWNNSGKLQKEHDEIQEKYSVSWGYTESNIMNMYIATSKIYYDVYNNDGCNLLADGFFSTEDYIYELVSKINSGLNELGMKHMLCGFETNLTSDEMYDWVMDKNKLEKLLDEIISLTYLNIKPFKIYTIHFDYDKNLISKSKKMTNSITFGEEKEMQDWWNHRVNQWNYKIVEVN